MNAQRLRNLTTGRLHTKMEHIYTDIEFLTGETGAMTHMLPNANRAMKVWLQEKVKEPRFWNGEYDTTHDGEVDILPMNESEKEEFWKRFGALPSPLFV